MLKLRQLSVFLLPMIAAIAFAQDAIPTSTALKLADGTPVILRTTRTISSADEKVGAIIEFQVVSPVRVDGYTVIAPHAHAFGTVTAVEPKARGARRGRIDIAIERVELITGLNAGLRTEKTPKPDSEGRSPATVNGSRRIAPLLLPALFLAHGNDVELPRGTKFTVYANGDSLFDRAALDSRQPTLSTVYVYRRSAKDKDALPLYCSGHMLGDIAAGAALQVEIEPGAYWFRSTSDKLVLLNLGPGDIYYLRLEAIARDKAQLVIAPQELGDDDLYSLPLTKLVNIGYISQLPIGTPDASDAP